MRISGRAICTNSVRMTAPTTPPTSDAVNAAARARAACPCCRQRKSVEHRCLARARAGNPHEYRGERVGRRNHGDEADQHGERGQRVHAVEERHHDGKPGDASEPGKAPIAEPQHHAEREIDEVLERCEVRKRAKQGLGQRQPSRLTRNSSLSHLLHPVAGALWDIRRQLVECVVRRRPSPVRRYPSAAGLLAR